MLNKFIIGVVFLLFCFTTRSVYAQEKWLSLKWKVPNKGLIYYITMSEMDTSVFKLNKNTISGFAFDSTTQNLGNRLFAELKKNAPSDFIARLNKNNKGTINVEMVANKKKSAKIADQANDTLDKLKSEVKEVYREWANGILLRGNIFDDGTMESFYTQNDQKNLIELMFQLPSRRVRKGDVWELDIHLLTADNNFKCDSSLRKNVVKLVDVKYDGDDTIALMQYQIAEYINGIMSNPMLQNNIPTTMYMTHNGIAEFSVKKGKWISYSCITNIQTSGLASSNSVKRVVLKEKEN